MAHGIAERLSEQLLRVDTSLHGSTHAGHVEILLRHLLHLVGTIVETLAHTILQDILADALLLFINHTIYA